MFDAAAKTIVALCLAVGLGSCGGSEDTPEGPAGPSAVVSSATGAFTLTTFPEDPQAGLRFADFVTEGTVLIENQGREAGTFELRQEIEFEDPDAGPRRASDEVAVRIVDTTTRGKPRELYRGPVADLDSVPVGEIPPGASRRYSFKLTPRTALHPSRLDLTYRWAPAGAAAPPEEKPAPPEKPEEPDKPTAPDKPAKPDKPAPKLGLRLRIPHVQRVLDTRRIVVFAICSRACRVQGRARLRGPGTKPIDLAVDAAGSGQPRRSTRLELRAPAKAFGVIRRALTKGPKVSVSLRVTAFGGGASAVATEQIRLKPVPEG